MRAEDPVEKISKCSTNSSSKNQMVYPALPNSDAFVDASVTVNPIRIDQSSLNFLGEDHIVYCTTI